MHVIFAFAIPLVLSLLPLCAGAGVYKWIGSDGQIYYSDRPVSGAERVGIPADQILPPSEDTNTKQEESAYLGSYSAFEIVHPEPNQTLRHAEGEIEISLLIDPPPSAEHRLEILLNGRPVPGDSIGPQVLLKGLSFGSHRVQARIRDNSDSIVASTSSVAFHLRKPLPESP